MSIRSLIQRAITTLALVATVGTTGSVATAQNAEFNIVGETSYQNFLTAVRSAEYVREDYIVGSVPDICPDDGEVTEASTPGTKPRVVAVVAATMAFVERNPAAGEHAMEEFINAYDAALQLAAPEDPDLKRSANFMHAVAQARVFSDINDAALDNLVGFDTDVADRVFELLDVKVPGPDGFDAVQNRMVQHQRSTTRDFGNRPEFGVLMVHAFLDQDPNGNRVNSRFSNKMRIYINGQGYWASQTERPELCAVNDAIAALPQTYEDYLDALDDEIDDADDITNPHQARIVTAINDAFGYSQDIIDQMADLLANEPTLYESVDNAQNQAMVDAIVAELLADVRASSGARAAVFGNSLILMQSEYDNLGVATYGQQQMDFGSAVFGVNNKYAYAKSSVRIAGSIAVIVASGKDDPATSIAAATDLVCESLEIASTASNGVTPDDIYDQVLQMRQQLADMQTQLNERFDRVEAKLDIIYESMMDGLYALGDRINDLQEDVSTLVREIYVSHSQLSRMEAALFGVAEDILLQDFTQTADEYLDYRTDGVEDLPYSVTSPNFRSGMSYMFTFTTTTSTGSAFAGSRDPSFTLDQADETVGSAPAARYLNDLAVNSAYFGVGELASETVVGPEAWAQGASAYVQLARENPWYFAYMYGAQYAAWQNDPDGQSPPDLHVIIEKGEALVDLIESARDEDLFNGLVANYKVAAGNLQDAIDDRVFELLRDNQPTPLANADTTLDLWKQHGHQNVNTLVPRLGRWLPRGGNENYALNLPDSGGRNGFKSVTTTEDGNEQAQVASLRSLLLADRNGGTWREALYRSGWEQSLISVELFTDDGDFNTWEHRRQIFYDRWVWDFLTGQFKYERPSNDSEARKFVADMWSELKDDIVTGDSVEGNSYTKSIDGVLHRLDVWRDQESDLLEETLDADTAAMLQDIRTDYIRPAIAFDIVTPGNPVYDAAEALNDAEAILDAYVTLAMPGALELSEVLTSALHSVPGNSELGLRSADVLAMVDSFTDADAVSDTDWGDPLLNLTTIGASLEVRVDELHDEINRALDNLPLEASAYLEWMLAETKALRDHNARLAVDDFYVSDNRLFRGGSVLDNDVWQPAGAGQLRQIELDPTFGPGSEGYIEPNDGTVLLSNDGTFTVIADEGFNGERVFFSYRLRCDISDDGSGVYAYSTPAIVAVRFVANGDDGLGSESGLTQPTGVSRRQP
ncbi:MAG: hypothetical protein ACF8R9_06170 [Phycisphaerales bacterium JB054]